MALGTTQKFALGAGIPVIAVIIGWLAFLSPLVGLLTYGFFSVCGFIIIDRMERRGWETSVSDRLQKIENTQDTIISHIVQAKDEIGGVKEHVSEAVQNVRPVHTDPPRAAPRPLNPVIEQDVVMPAAIRPGTPGFVNPRTYDTIVSGGHDISDRAVRELMQDAVKNGRIDMFLQPIVRLPQRKVRFYEMFARIRARPGLYLPAARYMDLAREENMMPNIDRLLLTECLDILRETAGLDRAAPFFLNITSGSLKSVSFMKKLLTFLDGHRHLAPRLVFEVAQQDFVAMQPAVRQIMDGLGKLGCAFSIDNVRTIDFDIPDLQNRKVRYVKIHAGFFIKVSKNETEFATLLRMKRKLEGNGITVIAEKIEDERMLKEILDFDLDYGQGFLFGKPDLQGAYQKKSSVGIAKVRKTG